MSLTSLLNKDGQILNAEQAEQDPDIYRSSFEHLLQPSALSIPSAVYPPNGWSYRFFVNRYWTLSATLWVLRLINIVYRLRLFHLLMIKMCFLHFWGLDNCMFHMLWLFLHNLCLRLYRSVRKTTKIDVPCNDLYISSCGCYLCGGKQENESPL